MNTRPTFPRVALVHAFSAEIIDFGRGSFARELLDREPEPEPQPTERYTLRGFADGYQIWDGWEPIATFHGPQLNLASKLLRLLKEEELTVSVAESGGSPPAAAKSDNHNHSEGA